MSNYYYAKINAQNICIGISDLSGVVTDPTMISIGSYDPELVGKYFNGSSFAAVAAPVNNDPVVSVALTAMGGAGLIANAVDFTTMRCTELQAVTLTATVPLPDLTTLTIPISRVDNGYTIFVEATVAAGEAVFSFSFPASGRWVCTEQMLNEEWGAGLNFNFAGVTATVLAG